MNKDEKKGLIEALLFIENEPVDYKKFAEALGIEREELAGLVKEMQEEYGIRQSGLSIVEIAEGYQMMVHPRFTLVLGRLYGQKARARLSQSTLEVLAIVAYKQPITKPEIEDIRGVNCERVIKVLLEKDLITVTGRRETPGKPLEFGTTKGFLKLFGLKSIKDLPQLRELKELEFSGRDLA